VLTDCCNRIIIIVCSHYVTFPYSSSLMNFMSAYLPHGLEIQFIFIMKVELTLVMSIARPSKLMSILLVH